MINFKKIHLSGVLVALCLPALALAGPPVKLLANDQNGHEYTVGQNNTIWQYTEGSSSGWVKLAAIPSNVGSVISLTADKENVFVGTGIGDVLEYANGQWKVGPIQGSGYSVPSMVVKGTTLYYVYTTPTLGEICQMPTGTLANPYCVQVVPQTNPDDNLGVASFTMDQNGEFYVSLNDGKVGFSSDAANWTPMSSVSTTPNVVMQMQVSDQHQTIYALLENGSVWSTPKGSGNGTWTPLSALPNGVLVAFLVMNHFSHVLYALGRDGVIYRYADSSWNALTPGSLGISALSINMNGYFYMGTNDGRILGTSGRYWSWELIQHSTSKVLAVDADDNLYTAGPSVSIQKLIAGTDQWVQLGSPLTGVSSLAFGSTGVVYAGGEERVYFLNPGSGWAKMIGTPMGGRIYSLLADSSGNVYAGGPGGAVVEFKSGGAQWYPIGGPVGIQNVNSLLEDSQGNLYAESPGSGIKELKVGQSEWINLSSTSGDGLALDNQSNVYASFGGQVKQYQPATGSWVQLGASIPGYYFSKVAVDPQNNLYAVASFSGRVAVMWFDPQAQQWVQMGGTLDACNGVVSFAVDSKNIYVDRYKILDSSDVLTGTGHPIPTTEVDYVSAISEILDTHYSS